MIEYIIILVILVSLFILCSFFKPLQRIRRILIKTTSGLAALLICTLFGNIAGISVGVNLLTISASVFLGIPGAIGITAISLIL